MKSIKIVDGDITNAHADAIVNATNPSMLGGGGVDGAIHRAAGPELTEACKEHPARNRVRCPIGQAKVTPAFKLNAKYVIHAVGPRYHIDDDPQLLLESAYKSSLHLAKEHNCKSIAFPAISCGAYGYPAKQAAEIALQTCKDEDIDIQFYLLGGEMLDIWVEALSEIN